MHEAGNIKESINLAGHNTKILKTAEQENIFKQSHLEVGKCI